MPKPNPAAELAVKLLHTLEQQRQSDGDFPLTVARLAALADPQATPEQVRKALGNKPFASRWVLAAKKDMDSPIALAEDGDRLADSPQLVEFALGRLCSAAKPAHTPAKVVGKANPSLRPAFQAALERRLAENALPPAVGVVIVRGKPQLYLKQFPPPKPPAEELSEKLVQVLAEQRERGVDSYPTLLNRLVEQTGLVPSSTVLKQALGREPFRSQAVLGVPGLPDSPVMMASDAERLAASPLLWRSVLTATRKPDNQALSVAEMKKKLPRSLQGLFGDAVNRQVSAHALPDGIGVLFSKKKPLLFLLADINAGRPTPRPAAPPAEPMPTPTDFARLFEEAFARLDRAHGAHNHVSLVDLRRAVPVERGAFDAGLRQLRRAGRYSLSAAEGRHGIRPEEQDAGIYEDGSLLLFVSSREV
jgi:hypothetical protein